MRIYLCSDFQNLIKQSGVGRASEHQQMALDAADVPYTLTDKEPYDIIHINTIFPPSYLKAKKAKRDGKTVVYHAHSTVEDFRDSFFFANTLAPLFGWWLKKCYQTADLILTPSNYSKTLIESYGIKQPVHVLSNGIDLDFWNSSIGEIKQFKEKYNLNANDKLVLSVGLQIKRKGLLDFVEMAKQLPEYQFIWFGYTDPKLLPKEISEAIQTDLPNLQFPGYIERDELRVAYQAADLYVFLTHEETEGIVLLEALASHTNTLVRDLPVFSDYQDRQNIYKGKNLKEFIGLTQEILEKKRPSLTEKGYRVVSQKSIPNIGEQLKRYYHMALSYSLNT